MLYLFHMLFLPSKRTYLLDTILPNIPYIHTSKTKISEDVIALFVNTKKILTIKAISTNLIKGSPLSLTFL